MGFIRDILVLSAALLSRAPHPSSPFLSPSSPLHDPRDEERKWSWDGGGGEREIHMASGNVPEIFLLQFYQISVSLFRNVFFPRRRSMISSGRKRAQIQNLNRCDFLRSKGTRANSPCVRPRLPYFFAVKQTHDQHHYKRIEEHCSSCCPGEKCSDMHNRKRTFFYDLQTERRRRQSLTCT